MSDRKNGSWREYVALFPSHAFDSWNQYWAVFTGVLALGQRWLGHDQLGPLGSPWIAGMLFFGGVFVYTSYRIYRDAVKEYETELQRIYATRPQFDFGFGKDGRPVEIKTATITPVDSVPTKERYASEQRARLDSKYERERASFLTRKNPFSNFGSMGEYLYERDQYDEDVDQFLSRWGGYLEEYRHYQLGRHCTIALTPVIANTGPVTARTVSVEIALPGELRLADEAEVTAYKDDRGDWVPERPRDPRATSDPMIVGFNHHLNDGYSGPYEPEPQTSDDPRGPLVLGQNRIRYNITSITAGQSEQNLAPFYVVADGISDFRVLVFRAKLYAEGLNQPLERTLVLRLNIENVATS